MKKYYLIISLLLLAILKINAQVGQPVNGVANPKNTVFAFTNANIVVNATTALQNATLVIQNGIIIGVGSNIKIPENATVQNMHGYYIYPSFIDLYSNYGINYKSDTKKANLQQFESGKKGAYSWNESIRAELNAAEYFTFNQKQSDDLLAAGFGTVVTQIQDGICRGTSALLATGNLPDHKVILNANIAAAFSFNKGSSTQDFPSSAMGAVALIRQTYLDGNWYKNQNAEVNLSLASFNKLTTLPFIFEAENKLAVLRAQKIANEFGSNYIIKGAGDEYQRAKEIKNTKSKLIIPINFPKPYEVEDPFDAEYVSTTDLKHWELAPANAFLLNKEQINFAFTMHGCTNAAEFLKNLRKAIQYGLPKQEALKALTETPANFLNLQNQIGSIKEGLLANFFITDQDIFSSKANIYQHWVLGTKHVVKDIEDKNISGKFKASNNAIINITNDANKLSATVIHTDTLKATITNNFDVYTLTFSTKKNKDLTRINFWVKEVDQNSFPNQVKLIAGIWVEPNGSTINFNASLLEPNKTKEKADTVIAVSFGEVIFPFTDYGSATLPTSENIIFKNATVWTNETPFELTETDLAVSNGKIVAVGKNLTLNNAKIINAKGKFLTNGIIDEHSHIAIYRGVNECTQAVTAEVSIGDVINCDDINIYRQLSGGVIGCQQLHGSCNPIGGKSSLIKLRWGLAPDLMKIENADGFIKFALGENVKQSNWNNQTMRYPQTRMGVEQVMIDAFTRAREYEKKLKENPKLTRKDLELDALVEILQKKRFISCHSYVQSEINMLMHVADSFNFKINTFTHILEGYKVADKMKAHGVNASTFADWWAYKYEVVDAIPQNGAILTKMGVTTAINSDDAEMGRRLNQEAAKMIKYGNLTEEQAWKMVTLNPAKMLHLDNRTGSIKVGKDADLVLWSDNPLSIYAKPEYTLVDGIIYFSIERDLQLRKQIQAERQRIIAKMIEAKQKGEKPEHKISAPDPNYHCEDEGW